MQRRRDVQPVNGEELLQVFQQTGRRLRILLLQPCGQLFDARDALVRVQFPGRPQQAFDPRFVVPGQLVEHLAQLLCAATLYLLVCTEDGVDSGAQRLGAVDDEQQLALGIGAAQDDVFEQIRHHCSVFRGAFPDARHMLVALRIQTHCAVHRVFAEVESVDVDGQQFQVVEAPADKSLDLGLGRLGRRPAGR